MRIAYFAYSDLSKPGAAVIHVGAIAGGLAGKGHSVDLLAPELCGDTEIEGVNIIRLKQKQRSVIGWARCAAEWLNSNNNYDAIYIRDFYFCNPVVKAAKELGISVVLEVNGHVGMEKSSGPISFKHRLFAEIEWRFYFKKRINKVDKIVAVAPGLIEKFAHIAGGNDKFALHPNGVDTELFSPATDKEILREELGIPPGSPLIGVVGSVLPYHVETPLIEAFELFLDEFPRACLIFVGGGPGLSKLKEHIHNSTARNSITAVGPVDVAQSAKYTASLDLALAWSIRTTAENGWPVRLSAYSACGIPIVGPDWGTYLYFAELGVLKAVDGNSPKAFAEAAGEILKDSELTENMGQKGREHAVQNLSWEIIVQKTENLLLELTGDKISNRS